MSRRLNLDLAVEDVIAAITAAADVAQPDLAIAFVSSAHYDQYQTLVRVLRKQLPSIRTIVGCSAYGVLGITDDGAQEAEHVPAVSLVLASLPKTKVSAVFIAPEDLPDGDAAPEAWAQLVGAQLGSGQGEAQLPLSFVVLADPSFMAVEELLAGLDYAFPLANKAGGLCSEGSMSSSRALFCWDAAHSEQRQGQSDTGGPQSGMHERLSDMQWPEEASTSGEQGAEGGSEGGQSGATATGVFKEGAVVLCLEGGVVMESIIAQGCRPVTGRQWTITKLGRDPMGRAVVTEVALETAGTGGAACSPMEALQAEFSSLRLPQPQLMAMLQNLTLGLAPMGQEGGEGGQLEAHQYLIRGMMPYGKQYFLVADAVHLGQRMCLMVRDRQGAEDDLQSHGMSYKRQQLQEMMEGRSRPAPFGVLAFTCNGRGLELFGHPHHDASSLQQFIPAPLAGFMCNGEIGRVGGATRLHGFTCSTAVLREAAPQLLAPSSSQDQDECTPS